MMIISSHITTSLNYRKAVPVRSDFYSITQFPEVYHAHGISKAAMFTPARRIAGQVRDTIYSKNAAETVAHLVFLRRSKPEVRKKIRNLLFSDLRRREEGFVLITQY